MIRTVLLALAVAMPAAAQGFTVPFADAAPQDPDFAAWRAELFLDVIARDVDAVVEKSDPGIRLSFGTDGGQEELRTLLSGDGAEEYWREIEEVLALGGTFESADAFTAPYTFTAELPETFDVYATLFVLGEATPILDAPDGAEIARTTGEVVQAASGEDFDAPFRKVVRSDGSEAYVDARSLRSALDYRALFNRIDGEWRMMAFVAGD